MTDEFNLQTLLQDVIMMIAFAGVIWILRKLGINIRTIRSEVRDSHESVKTLGKVLSSQNASQEIPQSPDNKI